MESITDRPTGVPDNGRLHLEELLMSTKPFLLAFIAMLAVLAGIFFPEIIPFSHFICGFFLSPLCALAPLRESLFPIPVRSSALPFFPLLLPLCALASLREAFFSAPPGRPPRGMGREK